MMDTITLDRSDDVFWPRDVPVKLAYRKQFSMQSIYGRRMNGLLAEIQSHRIQTVALVIDEINRGNVSSIFGELITLIEKVQTTRSRKRIASYLPYSKESFVSLPTSTSLEQ